VPPPFSIGECNFTGVVLKLVERALINPAECVLCRENDLIDAGQ